ncbi:GntR family transcriptional regulator [Anaerocolumna sp. MB42-C2]|uniref:GntR family transcriptional regulator n=1 Tax=Anaerocolumna sp. MB42-C2 TaxID=3070997 RepID=UPI0027E18E68|nr:GntR family transcriptional regulator [Anaerocolumna sp. MB42-C2]WMJ86063.1 GntR family transcriptional regulator [Anaerocolumna sp. MB42-C2]
MKFEKIDSLPLYTQLQNHIKKQIDQRDLEPGDQIPSETELQNVYGMSRVTIRKAIAELVKEGYLVKIQGKGTYVSQVADFDSTNNIRSFTKLCIMQGHATIAEVLHAGLVKGTKEQCTFLGLPEDSEVMCIKRVRKVDDIPMVLETNYFHPVFEFLKYDDLRYSLYDILISKYHILPSTKGLNTVSIRNVQGEEAEALKVKDNMATIYNQVEVFDDKGKAIHIVEEIVRVDKPEVFKFYL